MDFRFPISDFRFIAEARCAATIVVLRKSAIGFTLTELMVAVVITSLMILAINQVFTTVSEAVGRGAAVSNILAAHRVISGQVREDLGEMTGPSENGVLVIVNRMVLETDGETPREVHVLPGDDQDQNGLVGDGTAGAPDETRRSVRDDQIMFIRSYGQAQPHAIPLCPGSPLTYVGESGATSIKIWYGHPIRTHALGRMTVDPSDLPDNPVINYQVAVGSSIDPGPTGDVETDPLGLSDEIDGTPIPGINQFASNWIFGRQALFLGTKMPVSNMRTRGAFFYAPMDDPTDANDDLDSGLTDPQLYLDPITPTPPPQPDETPKLYQGMSDVAEYGLDATPGELPIGPDGPVNQFGAMTGPGEPFPLPPPPPYNNTFRLWETDGGTGTAAAINYAPRAYNYMYLPPHGNDPVGNALRQRLWVNPTPTPDRNMDGVLDTSGTSTHEVDDYYASWQLAQMHAYLAGHVSDIVIEFAGDYFQDNVGPNVLPGQNPAAIVGLTPGSDAPGIIDHYDDAFGNDVGTIWYGLDVVPPVGALGIPWPFVVETTAVADNNPIRDVSYDADADPDTTPNTDIRYVFRHNQTNAGVGTNWPHLIRIRYRLHDEQGRIASAEGEPGRWFEVILKVNRE